MEEDVSSYRNFKRLDILGLLMLIGGVLWEFGWDQTPEQYQALLVYFNIAILAHLVGVVGSYIYTSAKERTLRLLIFQVTGCLSLWFLLDWEGGLVGEIGVERAEIIRMLVIVALVALPTFVSLTHVFQWLIRNEGGDKRSIMPPALQFVLTLLLIIVAGSGLLMMPKSTVDGIHYLDAFFVSTSSVCVTGLCTVDFYNVFTFKGQIVVLALMQIGGFGVMTFAYIVALIAGQGLSLKDRVLFRDLFDDSNLNQAVSFVRNIVFMTLGLELVGGLLFYSSWEGTEIDLGGHPLAWHSAFHAVSAFCNAGFSSFPNGTGDLAYIGNKPGQGVFMILVLAGALGFSVYYEIRKNISLVVQQKIRHQKIRLKWTPYFKLVITTTIVLIIGGTILLYFSAHRGNMDMDWGDRLWLSFYDSVISRTSGFNYGNVGTYLPSGILLLCGMMIIGGSPGGTAGGIRTTVAAVTAGEIWRILTGRKHVQFYKRTVAPGVIDRCIATVIVSGVWIGVATVLCCFFDPQLKPLYLFFENCSAFATVGMSCGITEDLSFTSKCVIIVNMVVGRAGVFLFLMAVVGQHEKQYLHYPTVRIPLT